MLCSKMLKKKIIYIFLHKNWSIFLVKVGEIVSLKYCLIQITGQNWMQKTLQDVLHHIKPFSYTIIIKW